MALLLFAVQDPERRSKRAVARALDKSDGSIRGWEKKNGWEHRLGFEDLPRIALQTFGETYPLHLPRLTAVRRYMPQELQDEIPRTTVAAYHALDNAPPAQPMPEEPEQRAPKSRAQRERDEFRHRLKCVAEVMLAKLQKQLETKGKNATKVSPTHINQLLKLTEFLEDRREFEGESADAGIHLEVPDRIKRAIDKGDSVTIIQAIRDDAREVSMICDMLESQLLIDQEQSQATSHVVADLG